MVVIDHLGLVEDENVWHSTNAFEVIDARLNRIRDLALKHRVCLIGISETNKASMLKSSKSKQAEPHTSDLRGTARLGYTASTILKVERLTGINKTRIWQDELENNVFIKTDMWIYVLDCRRTGARKIKIRCYMNDNDDICEYKKDGTLEAPEEEFKDNGFIPKPEPSL